MKETTFQIDFEVLIEEKNNPFDCKLLLEEVIKKKLSFDKTRKSRIGTGKRLKKYHDMWQTIFLLMNLQAILWTIFSLIYLMDTSDKWLLFYTSSFTLYVIILQYYVATCNYGERALHMEFHQLKVEDRVIELKQLGREISMDLEPNREIKNKYEQRFAQIIDKYQLALVNIENHTSFDYEKANECEKIAKKLKDYSLDNILIWFNITFVLINSIVLIWSVYQRIV